MPQRILAFCQDRDLALFLRLTLVSPGYRVTLVRNSWAYLWALQTGVCALAVVNLINQEPRTMDLLQRAKKLNTPILTLLPGSDAGALEVALATGADDYVFAPLRPSELRLRAQALMWRSRAWKDRSIRDHAASAYAEIVLDPRALSITVRGRPARLTASEFLVISYLIENSGRVIGESEIITQVWGEEMTSADVLLAATVSRLRERIEPDPAEPRYLLKLEGSGYRFEPAPRTL